MSYVQEPAPQAPSPLPRRTPDSAIHHPERPLLISGLAVVSAASGVFLLAVGTLRVADPDAVSLTSGMFLLGELVLRGPIVFLLAAIAFLVNAWGLWTLRPWARWASIFLTIAQAGLAMPRVASALAGSNAMTMLGASLAVILRVAVVGYLTQDATKHSFGAD